MNKRSVRCAAVSLVAVLGASGCGPREEAGDRPKAEQATPAVAQHEGRARPRVVILGDSLTAGLGLDPEESYPVLLQHRVDAAGLDYDVVNASVSGDTSAGGLSRLEWSIQDNVRILVVALGANDGLRGLPAGELRNNLSQIIRQAQTRGLIVILAGMEAPPNFGPVYTAEFRGVYTSLAKEYGVTLMPFLLQGVAGDGSLNQADGIHPTATGARIVADNVWKALEPALRAESR